MAEPCETDFGGRTGFPAGANEYVLIPNNEPNDFTEAPLPPGATGLIIQISATPGGTEDARFDYSIEFFDVDDNAAPGGSGGVLHPGDSFISDVVTIDPSAVTWFFFLQPGSASGDIVNTFSVRADFFCGGATPTVQGQVLMGGAYTSLTGGAVPVVLSHGRSYAMIIGD